MAKQKTHIFIALVLVLLIIAAVTAWVTHDDTDTPDDPAEETPVPVTTATPMEPTETPEQTPTPVEPTDAPETPAPTATPEPEPEGDRRLNETGSFKSDTGTNLNLNVEYIITSKNDSTLSVRVNVYVASYSLEIGSRSGNTIYVNGQGYNFVSNPINHTDNNKLQKTMITTVTVDVPAAIGETVNIPISVDWHYRGAYSGQEIEHIAAESTVTVNA